MIDIKSTVQKVLAAAESSLLSIVTGAEPKVLEAAKGYVSNAEGRVTELLSYIADPSEETAKDKLAFLVARLKDEKAILESEFLSFVVMGKQVAQDAINSITTILVAAVGEILPKPEV